MIEGLKEALTKLNVSATTFNMTPREHEQFKIDCLNDTEGSRHLEDGYDCRLCRNKGYLFKLVDLPNGTFSKVSVPCKCEETRRSIMRMKRSGLQNTIKKYTFDKFEATEVWQKLIKKAAQDYAAEPKGWFFLGGQSGSGKTHLCTAICRELLLNGREVIYMLWRDDVVKIKGSLTDTEEYESLISKYKRAEVLYIDDLFKTGKADNAVQKPTAADINVAFEIINYRYCNPELLTIISSELTEDELIDVDEATGGRIFERSKSISISKNRDRNYRTKRAITL